MNIGTNFEIIDNGNIASLAATVPAESAKEVTFLSIITSDKGPEEFIKVKGNNFYNYFGKNISFKKHGQPLLQAANIINNGGTLYVKRLVPSDAKLANTYVTCVPTAVLDDVATEKVEESYVKLTYVTNTSTSATGIDDIDSLAVADKTILFGVTDNGRGKSSKGFKIIPQYAYSKNLGYIKYTVHVMENYNELEKFYFNLNPYIVENGAINSLENVLKNSMQVKSNFYEDNYDQILLNIVKECYKVAGYPSESTNEDIELTDDLLASDINYLKTIDILNAKDEKGKALELTIKKYDSINHKFLGENINVPIQIDIESADLDADAGVSLKNGAGELTFTSEDYASTAKNFLTGADDGKGLFSIYDVDNFMISVCVDANYPAEVKKAIHDLALFREDFFFFRDIGTTDNKTLTKIQDIVDEYDNSRYVSDCSLCYDIIDPWTLKQITITYGYRLAGLLVNHLTNNISKPVAGIINGITFDDAIKGTVNYIPIRKPDSNDTSVINDEREDMHDARINYAAYYNGTLAMDCEYTKNSEYTQLSFISNVLMTQEVIRAIRKECPKSRFSFATREDLERYSEAVNVVLSKYRSNFASLEFKYTADSTMLQNKIYNASIECTYKDFIQSETFTIFALPTE